MDQNSPEDIFTLGEYLGREQYGTRPLFYGQTYASKPALKEVDGGCVYDVTEGAPVYQRKEKATPDEKDSYEVVRHKTDYKYAQNMLFPRMYSDAHAQAYEDWLGGIKGVQVPYDQCGQMVMVKVPTQWDNIKFFFIYQLNYMYWRYFMWNFAGRQNDIQGQGEIEHGNWITGIPFVDKFLVGDQSLLPSDLKNNKGHNVFYCLPLILGLIGLFWQAYKTKRITTPNGEEIEEPVGIQQFWIVFFLFFMTGLAIVLYLNQTPMQPRERDYAYAGSFYAFAIWIGMGVAGIAQWLQGKLGEKPASVIATVVCLFVPIQMVSQTWDDHDRSNRYVARDFGQNYLSTVQEEGNPIIFTNGDNDTFPLWYNQETEGFRTDVRVCNLSYLQTDWYIDQMKRQAYDSPAVPIEWSRLEYVQGHNEGVAVRPEVMESINNFYKQNPEEAAKEFGDNPYELKNILKYWVRSPKEGLQLIPTDSIVIKLDKEAVKRSGMMIPDSLHGEIPDYMSISLKGKRMLYKSELMMLEMLANTNWERPLYMAITVGSDNHLNLGNNFMQEGLAYRIKTRPRLAMGNPGIHQHIARPGVKADDGQGRIQPGEITDAAQVQHHPRFVRVAKPGLMRCRHQRRALAARRQIATTKIAHHINAGQFRQQGQIGQLHSVASLRRVAHGLAMTPHRHHLRRADASLRQGQLAHFSVQARQLLSQAGGAIQFIIAHRLQGQNLGAQRIRIRQAGAGQYARLGGG
jgi:hypothetical protein